MAADEGGKVENGVWKVGAIYAARRSDARAIQKSVINFKVPVIYKFKFSRVTSLLNQQGLRHHSLNKFKGYVIVFLNKVCNCDEFVPRRGSRRGDIPRRRV
jgi:hypothetical protein